MINQHIYIQCLLKVIVYTMFTKLSYIKNGGNIND